MIKGKKKFFTSRGTTANNSRTQSCVSPTSGMPNVRRVPFFYSSSFTVDPRNLWDVFILAMRLLLLAHAILFFFSPFIEMGFRTEIRFHWDDKLGGLLYE